MKIHEYQGKQLFRKYGVPVPIGIPAMTVDEALAAIPKVQQQAGTDVVVNAVGCQDKDVAFFERERAVVDFDLSVDPQGATEIALFR